MPETLEQQASRLGWKLRVIDRRVVPPRVDLSLMNARLQGVVSHVVTNLDGTQYGISGVEDYSTSPRDKVLGMVSIYSAEHDEVGNLKLIDSASVRIFPGKYVLAQCHNPDDKKLAGLCRYLTGYYGKEDGKFLATDETQPSIT